MVLRIRLVPLAARCSFAVLVMLAASCAGQPDATDCGNGITCPAGTRCAAIQPVCITNDCGDGIVQATEACDDGNIEDGDGCAANCLSREVCGDGILNPAAGELCDDGNTVGGDGCAADCKSIEICGNGIRDVNEACDDGNTVPGDGCSGNCKSTEVCGNGIVDINEKCDDGGAPGGCNDDCQGGTGCGDGAIDRDGNGNALEECDDGNSDNQDDCTNQCKLNVCGDGIIQITGARVEECDPSVGFGETAACNLDCTLTVCGDNKINNAAGEECDEGAGFNADDRDCTSTCRRNVCGDGLVNLLGPLYVEQCDDMNSMQTDGCSNVCTLPICGNFIIEMGEQCDDGGTMNGDGCSSTCQLESCGDQIVNNGEQCDDGMETADCNVDCTEAKCGDGKVNQAAGEECDDANMIDTDACRNNCKLARCGDGVVGPGEACDDGDLDNSDGCNTQCTTPSCGNGIVESGEQCDDGNMVDTDGCRNTCVYATCGDGVVHAGVEECDDGAANNGDQKNCLANCMLNTCGDGLVDLVAPRIEACDDGNQTTEMACPYGIQACTLCNANCTAPLNLTGNVCGDGDLDMMHEECDDGNRITEAACPYGMASCTVCDENCTLVAKTGGVCGDGEVLAPFEVCDDGNANACGTCDNTCRVARTAAKATGFIVAPPGGPSIDGGTFTIDDGFGHVVTFEFDDGDMMVAAGNILIDAPAGATANQVRESIQAAIASSSLLVDTADAGSTGLALTHRRASALGNKAMTKSGGTSGLFLSGMSGGAAGDCGVGVGCETDADCASGDCDNSSKTCN